ncbi:hypothetical protein G7046_g1708 [Stylonectria norvegica]|nr:hypothetical protein G7046_g1708 [Stylonectria norvegica]
MPWSAKHSGGKLNALKDQPVELSRRSSDSRGRASCLASSSAELCHSRHGAISGQASGRLLFPTGNGSSYWHLDRFVLGFDVQVEGGGYGEEEQAPDEGLNGRLEETPGPV